HQWSPLHTLDMLEQAAPGAIFLLNAPYEPGEVWGRLPARTRRQVLEKKLRMHVIDATQVAQKIGMGGRINSIMQTCFFALSGVLPRDEAIAQIKKAIRKAYERKGEEVVRRNFAAVDETLAHLHEVPIPTGPAALDEMAAAGTGHPSLPRNAPDFVKRVTSVM